MKDQTYPCYSIFCDQAVSNPEGECECELADLFDEPLDPSSIFEDPDFSIEATHLELAVSPDDSDTVVDDDEEFTSEYTTCL